MQFFNALPGAIGAQKTLLEEITNYLYESRGYNFSIPPFLKDISYIKSGSIQSQTKPDHLSQQNKKEIDLNITTSRNTSNQEASRFAFLPLLFLQ